MLLDGQSEIIHACLLRVGYIDERVVTAPCVDKTFDNIIYVCEVAHIPTAVYEPDRFVMEKMPKKSPLTGVRSIDIVQADTGGVRIVTPGILFIETL